MNARYASVVAACGCLISANTFAQTQPTCPKGFQPYVNRCISQRMADYISCVEVSGGNSGRIESEVSNANAGKTDVGVKGSGSGVVAKGSGSVTVDRATEQALASKFEHTWTDKGMEECRKALDPQGPLPSRNTTPRPSAANNSHEAAAAAVQKPSEEDTLVKDAQIDWSIGNREDAVSEFLKASQLNPKDYLPHKCLAVNYASKLDFDDAVKEYELAAKASNAPEESKQQAKLAIENRKALNNAFERTKESPFYAKAHFDLAELLYTVASLGTRGRANEECQSACAFIPKGSEEEQSLTEGACRDMAIAAERAAPDHDYDSDKLCKGSQ